MFTLTRLLAALMMLGFLLWIAPVYDDLYDPQRPLRGLAQLLGTVGFVTGWAFLGNRARALWFSAYLGVQAVALAGLGAALLAAVADVFRLGFRRRFDEPVEAVLAIPQLAWDYLWLAISNREMLLTLVVGGLVMGLVVHVVDRVLDRRRLAR